jgi:catechol 2,3-dioxygenase-like lactoylglutathione lyase family enzyme
MAGESAELPLSRADYVGRNKAWVRIVTIGEEAIIGGLAGETRMIDHTALNVEDYARAKSFYDAVLGTLGLTARAVGSFCGYGNFYLIQREPVARGVHLAWKADSHEAVRAFHVAGLQAGGTDNGAPGLRPYGDNYYAAFVLDPEGNNVEAVCTTG